MITVVVKPFNLLPMNLTHIFKEHCGFQASHFQATLCSLYFFFFIEE